MKSAYRLIRSAARQGVALLLCWGQIVSALAAPAQQPLLGRSDTPVEPNVLFTMDDSGSMSWNYMPDEAADGDFKIHPDEPDQQFDYFYTGPITTRLNDHVNARQRSTMWNKLYYDPEVRYQPWTRSDGTLMPDSDPTQAPVDPIDASKGRVDLTGETLYSGFACMAMEMPGSTYGECRPVTAEPIAAATWYEYVGPPTAGMTPNERFYQSTFASNFTRVRIMDHTSFTRGAARTDCTEVSAGVRTCTRAQEYRNFANWYTYSRKRYSQAVTALSAAFAAQGKGLRLGYGRINAPGQMVDGVTQLAVERGVRPFEGADREAFFTWLFNTPPTGGTPLLRAQDDAGMYFSRTDDDGPWGKAPGSADATPHLACRKSYHILMTDGGWNDAPGRPEVAANVDGESGPLVTGPGGQSYQYVPSTPFADNVAGTLADAALYHWYRDLRPDLPNRVAPMPDDPAFWQHLTTFTIGLGVQGELRYPDDLPRLIDGSLQWSDPTPMGAQGMAAKVDDLWHAALNSRGRYLNARNGPELAEALNAILAEIARRSGSIAGVSVNGRTLTAGTRKYVPNYQTGSWTGEVTAHGVAADGTTTGTVWTASAGLPAHDHRNIVVGTGGALPRALPFRWDSLTPAVKTALGTDASAQVVDWLRGDRSEEGGTLRARESLLGDVVNSAPIYVKDSVNSRYQLLPPGTAGRDTYAAFLDAKKARTAMIWFGANDGMLHALREADGVEAFAFVPNAVLGNLARLASPTYQHRYFVDGPLVEADAHLDGAWRSVLVGSTGAGARSVFALNVSNPEALGSGSVLWELDQTSAAELGHVLSPVEVGRLRNGRWAAVFGNGYDSTSQRASLFVVDLENGSVIRRIDTGVGSAAAPNGLGGVRVLRDGQQTIIGAYAGDLRGNVWKFDLAANAATDWAVGFSGSPLHTLQRTDGTAQAVTAPPAIVSHPRGGHMVVVGTGKLFEEGDETSTAAEALYGLWDTQKLEQRGGQWLWSADARIPSAARIKTRALMAITGSDADYFTIKAPAIDWSVDRGWSLPLSMMPSQRVTIGPQLVTGMALFETVVPLVAAYTGDPCDIRSDAAGYNLLVDPISGGMSASPVIDITGDGTIDSADTAIGGWKTGGWGGASAVLRDPPREVCLGAGCAGAPASPCPPGQVRSNLQNAASAGGTNVCVAVPAPQRWWWRQITNP